MPKKTDIADADLLDYLDKGIPEERIALLYRVSLPAIQKRLARIEAARGREADRQETLLRAAMGGRPCPPIALLESPDRFAPAHELLDWTRKTFLSEDGRLYNADHDHLTYAGIAFLWTSAPYKKQGRIVAGLCEMPSVQGNVWVRGRMEMQLMEWFEDLPRFLITLSAPIAATMDDASFCALIEHELYHIGQAEDAFGFPKFNDETGLPTLVIKGHDCEEHIGVVRRYGVGAAADGVAELVAAAARPPSVAAARIAQACGTCLR